MLHILRKWKYKGLQRQQANHLLGRPYAYLCGHLPGKEPIAVQALQEANVSSTPDSKERFDNDLHWPTEPPVSECRDCNACLLRPQTRNTEPGIRKSRMSSKLRTIRSFDTTVNLDAAHWGIQVPSTQKKACSLNPDVLQITPSATGIAICMGPHLMHSLHHLRTGYRAPRLGRPHVADWCLKIAASGVLPQRVASPERQVHVLNNSVALPPPGALNGLAREELGDNHKKISVEAYHSLPKPSKGPDGLKVYFPSLHLHCQELGKPIPHVPAVPLK
eukprot:1161503-Pelagomonas_calceolata.AAC.13